MHILCVIPARLASARLPEKPLCLLSGEPLVAVVARRVLQLGLGGTVVVATDDERVVEAVAPLGIEGVMTDPRHRSGTERAAAVARLAPFADADVVLNVQGDEPFFPAEAALGALERVRLGDPIGTSGAPLADRDVTNPNRVKVVVDQAGRALRFARVLRRSEARAGQVEVLHHIGIYAYSREALLRWSSLEPVPAERVDDLEQQRPLAYGMPIGVARVAVPVRGGIDTEEDLADAENYAETMMRTVLG